MNETLLFESFENEIILAFECLNSIVEIDTYMDIFESEKPEVKSQTEKNNDSRTGAIGHIQKAIDALLKIISGFINKIKSFFSKNKLDEREKEMNVKFAAAKKKNPGIGKKKISVLDTNKFNNEADSLLKEAENACKSLENGQDVGIESIISKISNFCSSGVSAVTVSIGMEAALQAASSSKEMAQKMVDYLEKNQEITEKLKNSVGDKQYKKFSKDLNCMTKSISMRQWIMRLQGYRAQSFEDAVMTTYKECDSVFTGMGELISTVMQNPTPNDGSLNKFQQATGMAKHLIKNRKDVGQAVGKLKENNGGRILGRMYGNDTVKKVVGGTIDHMNKENEFKRTKYKQSKKAIKDAEKLDGKLSGKGTNKSDQSLLDSMTGRYDSNAATNKSKAVQTLSQIAQRLG